MKSARRALALIAWTLMFPCTVGAVLQVATPESSPPTPIEQALMEHVCSVVPPGGAPESDRYLACLRTQLLTLRTDFGRDLSRLSAAERRTLDSMCNEVRTRERARSLPGLPCRPAQLPAQPAKPRQGGRSAAGRACASTRERPIGQCGAAGEPGGFGISLVVDRRGCRGRGGGRGRSAGVSEDAPRVTQVPDLRQRRSNGRRPLPEMPP